MAKVPPGYRIGSSWRTKRKAKKVAKGSRKRGFYARVVYASKNSRALREQRKYGQPRARWLVVYKPKKGGWGGRKRRRRR